MKRNGFEIASFYFPRMGECWVYWKFLIEFAERYKSDFYSEGAYGLWTQLWLGAYGWVSIS